MNSLLLRAPSFSIFRPDLSNEVKKSLLHSFVKLRIVDLRLLYQSFLWWICMFWTLFLIVFVFTGVLWIIRTGGGWGTWRFRINLFIFIGYTIPAVYCMPWVIPPSFFATFGSRWRKLLIAHILLFLGLRLALLRRLGLLRVTFDFLAQQHHQSILVLWVCLLLDIGCSFW